MFLAMDLSFLSQLNLIFYVIIGLAVLMGFLRGMKKTLFSFITMVIFYVVFFLTINSIVNVLWSMNMPWLGQVLGNVDSSLSGFTSFEDSYGLLIEFGLGDTLDLAGSSAEVTALLIGLVQFVLKIVWTILYFTVILVLYKLICLIIRAIFLKSKKGESKNRGFGALFGALNGLLAVFVFLIMLGGIISVTESAILLLESSDTPTEQAYIGQFRGFDENMTVIPLAETEDLNQYTEDLQDMVDGFYGNIFVQLADRITTPSSINSDVEVPLYLDLFDRVLSFEYKESSIGLRYELAVFSEAATYLLNSDFMDTNEITDITGDEIRGVFSELSHSVLIVNLVPVAIEMGADYFEMDLGITTTDLYAINFEEELGDIGAIAGSLFDILNGAGVLSGDGEIDPTEITPASVRELFGDIGDSEVMVLVTENLLIPMLEEQEGGFFLNLPAEINIEDEYEALGEIFASIVDLDIAFDELADADVGVLLSAVSEIDLLILLDSELVSTALINILSGQTDIEGLDILEIPTGLEWRDTLTQDGELRKILTALNSFVTDAGDIDFSNLDIDALTNLSDQAIEDFFGSYVIRATVTSIITSTDLGDVPLTFPDTVYDGQDYFTETELINVLKAVKLILGDVAGEFDILEALDLDASEMNTLLASEIIKATVGQKIYELGSSSLVIPSGVLETVVENGFNVTVVNETEIRAILQALNVLDITNLDTMTFDAGIMSNLEDPLNTDNLSDTKINTLLGSSIIHATVSDMIIDLDGGVIDIPTTSPTDADVKYSSGGTEYIHVDEIGNILKALHGIDVDDFSTIDFEETSLLMDNLDILLDSAIIHATVSGILLDLSPTVTIPEKDSNNAFIIINKGTTNYIDADEISNMLDVVNYMGLLDPTDFTSSFDLTMFDDPAEQTLLLDSAIMHASISQTLFDLETSGYMIIPDRNELDDEDITVTYGTLGNETDYVVKSEIIDIINAMNAMSVDIDSLDAEIPTATFLANAAIILESSTFQATISEQIITPAHAPGGSEIFIPDDEIVTVGLDVFITKVELTAFIDAVNDLQLDNFDTFTFNSNDVFTKVSDLNAFFDSRILQASVSRKILPFATNAIAPAADTLIVPNALRESIDVQTVTLQIIQKPELINLLNGLDELGFSFNGTVSGDVFTGLDKTQLSNILDSGSLHITFDYMLSNNANIDIPKEALVGQSTAGVIYGVSNVVTKDELVDFIYGATLISGDIEGSLDFLALTTMQKTDRDVVVESMIIRNTITPNLELVEVFGPGDYVAGSDLPFLTILATITALDDNYPV